MTNWVHFSRDDACLLDTGFFNIREIQEEDEMKHIVIYDYFVILLFEK